MLFLEIQIYLNIRIFFTQIFIRTFICIRFFETNKFGYSFVQKHLYEYIWIDAEGNLRGKTKVINQTTKPSLEELPIWNYDGSSTGQANGNDSEVLIRPCAIFKDPFHNIEKNDTIDGSFLVMCDTYLPNMKPHLSNARYPAEKTFENFSELKFLRVL